MENITIGQIMSVCGVIVAIGGFAGFFWKMFVNLKKYLTKIIVTELEPIKDSLKELDSKIDKTDMQACKNYLVSFLADVEQGGMVDEIERQRFWEQMEHYENLGGNGYIHQKVERLKGKNLL